MVSAALTTLLLSLAPLLLSAKGYSSRDVRALDGISFDSQAIAEKVTMAVFHAPWCGHCRNLEPDYQKAAKNLHGLVNFVSVDCDEEQNKRLCAQYGVQGFPTIKAFPGKNRKHPRDYTGQRTAKAIVDYAVDMMPSYVKRLKGSTELQSFLDEQRTKPASLLLTSAATVTPLYKALSTDFKSKVDFYAIKNADELDDAKKALGITKVPSIVVWHGPGQVAQAHTGALKYDDLYAFYLDAARRNTSSDARDRSELGKPKSRETGVQEWTVLAGFVLSRGSDFCCISLGTGVKATPYEKLSVHGDVLHDCHAEVIARRGLLLWLSEELKRADASAWLSKSADGLRLRLCEDVHLHLYVSTLPCGDASTSLLADEQDPDLAFTLGGNVPSVWQNATDQLSNVARGRAGYANIGTLRTKPGRADSPPSYSMSCSDKIASWLVYGVQGAMLSRLIEPIRPSTLVFGSSTSDIKADTYAAGVRRALYGRVADCCISEPQIFLTSLHFLHERPKDTMAPIASSPLSLSWVRDQGVEVIASGIKQGASVKRSDSQPLPAVSRLCKRDLYQHLAWGPSETRSSSYHERKHDGQPGVRTYQESKAQLRQGPFAGWLATSQQFEGFLLS